MDGNFDKAGVFFAALVIVGAIPLALVVFRRRESIDPITRFAGRGIVIATLVNGVVNVIRRMGYMPDDPTYQTLDISSLAYIAAMMWIYWRRQRRRHAKQPEHLS